MKFHQDGGTTLMQGGEDIYIEGDAFDKFLLELQAKRAEAKELLKPKEKG